MELPVNVSALFFYGENNKSHIMLSTYDSQQSFAVQAQFIDFIKYFKYIEMEPSPQKKIEEPPEYLVIQPGKSEIRFGTESQRPQPSQEKPEQLFQKPLQVSSTPSRQESRASAKSHQTKDRAQPKEKYPEREHEEINASSSQEITRQKRFSFRAQDKSELAKGKDESIPLWQSAHGIYHQQLQKDINELPLYSIVSLGKKKNENNICSSGSDTSEPKTINSKKIEKDSLSGFSLGDSEEGNEFYISIPKCQRCKTLENSLRKYTSEHYKQATELISLKKEKQELQQPCNKSDPVHKDPDHNEPFQADGSLGKRLVAHVRKIHEGLESIHQPGFHEPLQLTGEQYKLILLGIEDLKYLLKIIEKGYRPSQQHEAKILHKKYKAIIESIQEHYEHQISKLNRDFKDFVTALQEKQKSRSRDKPSQDRRRLQKKMNSLYVSTQDFMSASQNTEINLLKDQIELLEASIKEEKKKNKNLDTINKALHQKYSKELNEGIKQKALLLRTIKRHEYDFEKFMEKMTSNSCLTNEVSHYFFTCISQRIFQISNCIPFEENDQQSLFAPDNQEELFDMIERIRRFVMKIDDFASQKDINEINLKKNVILLFKNLVDVERVSLKTVLKLIKNNPEWQLDFLRDYLVQLHDKKSKRETIKDQPALWSVKKKKSMSLQKMEGLGIGDCTPQFKRND